jgi:beta-N-acetylhexosaminidase
MKKKDVDPRMADINYLKELFVKYHVGSIIFLYRGTMAEQVTKVREFVELNTSNVPLMVAEDLEPGLEEAKSLAPGLIGLTDMKKLPMAATLGAMDDKAVYEAGRCLAQQAQKLGVQVIFAPVVDVNSNSNNPIIGKRSFGACADVVAHKAGLLMQGIQDQGVMSVIKHFPGHGDTGFDTHYGLGTVPHDMKRLDAVELAPFKAVIAKGAQGVMTAHLLVPAIDSVLPMSVSSAAVTKLKEYKFNGLIFTDAMDMKAMDRSVPGRMELQSVLAGVHVVVVPYDLPAAHAQIVAAVKSGELSEVELDNRVTQVVAQKLRLGNPHPSTPEKVTQEVNELAAQWRAIY